MTRPRLLFPSQPFSPHTPDDAFAGEFDAARQIGFDTHLYSHEGVLEGEWGEALRGIRRAQDEVTLILRGWMLTGEQYTSLHERLLARNYRLLTPPAAYEQAHYLPLAYPHIEPFTARSKWILGDDEEAAWALYHEHFCARDALIKDWVKSAKYHWKDGCFIPAHTSRERFGEIYKTFRQARSTLFNRGVVLREYLDLASTGREVRGIPEIDEVRLFFFDGELLIRPLAKDSDPLAQEARWTRLARLFSSRFMTMDIAREREGAWSIIEVGDGGVSGLPGALDPTRFYAALWNKT